MKDKPNILVCPLDWGIGHATRCVPVIKELLSQNTNVIIGADGRPLAFLKQEFPTLQYIEFPGYKFSYPEKGSMAIKMAKQAPGIIKGIKEEKQFLEEIIQKNNINAVISDNRYGLSTDKIPSIFITHQMRIKVPSYLRLLEPNLYKRNLSYISKFKECWIPDFETEPNLSGDLSHKDPLPTNCYYVDPLSRFINKEVLEKTEYKYDILALLSGPEPQRTILEKKIIKDLKNTKLKSIVICGKPEVDEVQKINNNITLISHLESKKLREVIDESKLIISRPGYSTVMDLVALGKKAIFIPTPGQTEQEYLATFHLKKGHFYKMSQSNFDLQKALDESKDFYGFELKFDSSMLKVRISKLLASLKD